MKKTLIGSVVTIVVIVIFGIFFFQKVALPETSEITPQEISGRYFRKHSTYGGLEATFWLTLEDDGEFEIDVVTGKVQGEYKIEGDEITFYSFGWEGISIIEEEKVVKGKIVENKIIITECPSEWFNPFGSTWEKKD